MTGTPQRVQLLLLSGVRLIGKPQMNEHAVAAVNLRWPQSLAINRNQSLTDLAGAFSDELFQPGTQIVNPWRRDDGNFVSAKIPQRSQNCGQNGTRILIRGNFRLTELHHFDGALKKFAEIKSHDGGWDHAKVGEGRVASADAGQAKEDIAEVITLRYLLHFGAGIGNGNEVFARFVLA